MNEWEHLQSTRTEAELAAGDTGWPPPTPHWAHSPGKPPSPFSPPAGPALPGLSPWLFNQQLPKQWVFSPGP